MTYTNELTNLEKKIERKKGLDLKVGHSVREKENKGCMNDSQN